LLVALGGSTGSDHYRPLGIGPGATAAEVRRAYLAQARRHHPDRHLASTAEVREEHERAMRAANAAWAVLGDPAARRRFDAARAEAAAADTPRGAARGGPSAARAREARWAAEDEAKARWRPFDDGPDEVDPRLRDDDAPAQGSSRPLTLGRTVRIVLGLGLGFFVGGALSGVATLAGAGIVMCVVGGAMFLVMPLLALGRSVRNDKGVRNDRR
jgi:curved DNA-binding protein CbpA